jgi:hypothetical protein
MLLIKVDQYGCDTALYGEKKEDRHSPSFFNNRLRLNTSWRCEYVRFNALPKMHGQGFEEFELMGKRLVGYINCPQWALSNDNPTPDGASLSDLVLYHVNRKVETDFRTWIKQNPLIRPSRYRTNMSIFRTYEGELWLFYLQNGLLDCEQITETSFVREGFITTLKEAMRKQRENGEEQLKKIDEMHEKVEKSFDLPKLLDGENLLSFVRER